MTTHERQDDALDDLFGAARAVQHDPSAALMQRVLAEGLAAQPVQAAPPVPVRGTGGWRGFLQGLGGWPAIGGLTAATVTGFWIGIAPPAALGDWASAALGTSDTVGIATEGDLFGLTEG